MKGKDVNLAGLERIIGVASVDVIVRARDHLVGGEIIVAAGSRVMGCIKPNVFERLQRGGRTVSLVKDALEISGWSGSKARVRR